VPAARWAPPLAVVATLTRVEAGAVVLRSGFWDQFPTLHKYQKLLLSLKHGGIPPLARLKTWKTWRPKTWFEHTFSRATPRKYYPTHHPSNVNPSTRKLLPLLLQLEHRCDDDSCVSLRRCSPSPRTAHPPRHPPSTTTGTRTTMRTTRSGGRVGRSHLPLHHPGALRVQL